MDIFLSSPDLYDDLAQKKFCCGTVRLHRKGPQTPRHRFKHGDMCLLTNIHNPPREGNCRNEHRNVIKPAIVVDYNHHMGHVDNADRMVTSYTASHRTWKWTKKLFFHLLDLATLNSYILLSSCSGKKISHRFSNHPYQSDAGTGWS